MPASPLAQKSNLINGTLQASFGRNGSSGTVLVSMNITKLTTTDVATANFTFMSSVSQEKLAAGVTISSGEATVWMDRGKTLGFDNPFFTDKVSGTVDGGDSWELEMVVDHSVWELFLAGGERSSTMTFFPKKELDTVLVASNVSPGVAVGVKIWELQSGWAKYENATGYVTGNTTASV